MGARHAVGAGGGSWSVGTVLTPQRGLTHTQHAFGGLCPQTAQDPPRLFVPTATPSPVTIPQP